MLLGPIFVELIKCARKCFVLFNPVIFILPEMSTTKTTSTGLSPHSRKKEKIMNRMFILDRYKRLFFFEI